METYKRGELLRLAITRSFAYKKKMSQREFYPSDGAYNAMEEQHSQDLLGGADVVTQRMEASLAARPGTSLQQTEDDFSEESPRKKPKIINISVDDNVRQPWKREAETIMTEVNAANFCVSHVNRKQNAYVRITRRYMKDQQDKSFSMDIPITSFEVVVKACHEIMKDKEYRVSLAAAKQRS